MSQTSVSKLPADQQDAVMESTRRASQDYPSVLVEGHLLHVCQMGGEWEVWLNCEDADFTGLCLAVSATRQAAVQQAVTALEAAVAWLQASR